MGGVKICRIGGAEGIRTPDPHNAIVVLYQLSYDPNPSAVTLGVRTLESQSEFRAATADDPVWLVRG